MLELMVLLCLSGLSAGVFLGIKQNILLLAVGAGMLVGVGTFLVGCGQIPSWGCFVLGALCSAVVVTVLGKCPRIHGLLAACIGGCQWGLWTTFHNGLGAVGGGSIVLFLYTLFYLMHIPALLLTFEAFRLPKDWWEKANRFGRGGILAVGLGMPLLICGAALLPGETLVASVTKILLTTALFWLSLSVTFLLAAWRQKQEQTTAEGNYHREMNTFMNVVRSQRHDYNLHVQTVASLIAQQKWEECRTYVNALVQDTNEVNAVLPVKDPAVASLINNYRILVGQKGHTLVLAIRNDLSQVVTSPYETNKIIGNLLQNALDELSNHSEPEQVELSIFKRGEYCLVSVSNRVAYPQAFSSNQESFFHQGFTTKQGHDGVGLSSIRTLARSYGGDVTAWMEGDVVHFVASIPIRLTLG